MFCGQPCEVSVRYDADKGPLVCAFYSYEQRLAVFDAELHRLPLYMYQLHPETGLVFWSRNIIFSVQRDVPNAKGGEKLWVVSTLLAGTGGASSFASGFCFPDLNLFLRRRPFVCSF